VGKIARHQLLKEERMRFDPLAPSPAWFQRRDSLAHTGS
jgi:hypothetical protein